jgi:hypothetical protein
MRESWTKQTVCVPGGGGGLVLKPISEINLRENMGTLVLHLAQYVHPARAGFYTIRPGRARARSLSLSRARRVSPQWIDFARRVCAGARGAQRPRTAAPGPGIHGQALGRLADVLDWLVPGAAPARAVSASFLREALADPALDLRDCPGPPGGLQAAVAFRCAFRSKNRCRAAVSYARAGRAQPPRSLGGLWPRADCARLTAEHPLRLAPAAATGGPSQISGGVRLPPRGSDPRTRSWGPRNIYHYKNSDGKLFPGPR